MAEVDWQCPVTLTRKTRDKLLLPGRYVVNSGLYVQVNHVFYNHAALSVILCVVDHKFYSRCEALCANAEYYTCAGQEAHLHSLKLRLLLNRHKGSLANKPVSVGEISIAFCGAARNYPPAKNATPPDAKHATAYSAPVESKKSLTAHLYVICWTPHKLVRPYQGKKPPDLI